MAEIVVGLNSVSALVERYPQLIITVSTLDREQGRLKTLTQSLQSIGIRPQVVDGKTLDKLGAGHTHQGVVAQVKNLPMGADQDFVAQINREQSGGWLFLDGVTDPHNLGACMRSAAAFGVQGVVVPKDASVSLNATVMKASAGMALNTPFFRVTNLSRALEQLRKAGFWVYGAEGDGQKSQALARTKFEANYVVVMGSEGKGLRKKTLEYCDFQVSIPMSSQVESLNVSVACGIFLYQAQCSQMA